MSRNFGQRHRDDDYLQRDPNPVWPYIAFVISVTLIAMILLP